MKIIVQMCEKKISLSKLRITKISGCEPIIGPILVILGN